MELPALLGGSPARPGGPPSWPPSDPEIHHALEGAFVDGAWGKYHGGRCARLVQSLADYFQRDHVLLMGSGTYAVELGLRALQVGPGDEVIQAAYDYEGNFHAIHALGAMPVLVDLDPANANISINDLEQALSPKTKAIVVSHLHGGLAPMRAVLDFARRHRLKVLEDAAQCPGALVDGQKAGCWGDAGVLSFGGSKLLSAGRGGALLTAQADVAQRARLIVQRGQNLVCPLSELQAAVLLPQLSRLDPRNELRRKSVAQLKASLNDTPALRFFTNSAGDHQPGYYKLGLWYEGDQFGLERSLLVAAMRAEGIALDEGYQALHVGRSPRRWRRGASLETANRAHRAIVMLHHPILLEETPALEQLVQALKKIENHRERIKEKWVGDPPRASELI